MLPAVIRCLQITVVATITPGVYLNRPISSHPLKLVFLEHTQESDLGLDRKLSDLVQKDRAAFGQLEASETSLSCAGERPLLVPETAPKGSTWWDSSAIDTHKRTGRTRRPFVE